MMHMRDRAGEDSGVPSLRLGAVIRRAARTVVNLLRWLHRHRWEQTHENRWHVGTAEECWCGAKREVAKFPNDVLGSDFWWCATTGQVWAVSTFKPLSPKRTRAAARVFAAALARSYIGGTIRDPATVQDTTPT